MNRDFERSEQIRRQIREDTERHRQRQTVVMETLLENRRREQAWEFARMREAQYEQERAMIRLHQSQIDALNQRHSNDLRQYGRQLLDQQTEAAHNLVREMEERLRQQRPMDVDENNNNRAHADVRPVADNREPAQALEFRPVAERAHRAPGALDVYHFAEADARLLAPFDHAAMVGAAERLAADVRADRLELPRVRPLADYVEREDEDEVDADAWENQDELAFYFDVPRAPRAEAAVRERFRARRADARDEDDILDVHAYFDAERSRQHDATAAAVRVAAAEAAAAAAHADTAAAAARARIRELREENEQSNITAPRFCRECPICDVTPLQRAVFACGHVVCLACAEEIKLAAEEDDIELICPTCRDPGEFAKLWEKRNEEDGEAVEQF